jgi:hypothetical protein
LESKPWIGRLLAAAFLFVLAGAPAPAQEGEEATAPTLPWSGWWWPADSGQLLLGYRGEVGPLIKHDVVSGRHATQWEQSNPFHFDLADAADWWGHCHAWAAAAVLEPEPRHDVTQSGTTFHVGDLKGLLAEAHYSDQVVSYGTRFYGQPGDDLEDMYPAAVWYVLRNYIYQNKTPIVFDLNPGPQVWSYPAYYYRLSYQPISADAYQKVVAAALPWEKRAPTPLSAEATPYQGQLQLRVATFQVKPDVVGTATEEHFFTFVFQGLAGQIVPNTDHWSGASVQDHPDFAWYPTQRGQQNPGLDYNLVSQLNSQAH